MDIESGETDNDDHLSFGNDSSTDDNDRKNPFIEQMKKSSNTQSDPLYNFDEYSDIYERIYSFYCQNEHEQWHLLFNQLLQQSSTPYRLLFMFLDHTLSTSNSRKHKMVVPLIEQFKQNQISNLNMGLNDPMKTRILSKICRRCTFNQLEPIVEIFDLRSLANRSLVIDFIDEQFEQHQDIIFIAHMTKILRLLVIDAIPSEKILLPLILKSQWETVRLLVDDERKLQERFLHVLDELISTDLDIPRRLLAQCGMNINVNYLDVRNLKRAARKFLKQYQFDLHQFPNLALQEKTTFLQTLFVRKYLDRTSNDEDQQSWNEQIQELVGNNRDLQIKLVDLFIDYSDIDQAAHWAQVYNLEDSQIPDQVRRRRQENLTGGMSSESASFKPTIWSMQQSEENVYKPTVLPNDIVYIEVDSDVDSLLNRLECSRCAVGSHLPFVGFDCETFMDPTQRTLNSQIVSIIQLATLFPSRKQSLYGIFDMLALRLQMDMKNLAEFAQRLFCSRDFLLLTYNYAGDTSSLIENYPSMSDALMQGTAVIDLCRVQQYIIEHHPDIFPYYQSMSQPKSRGLSELIRLCFGKPLDKSLQTSDWRKRPLKQAQLIYSVLDARVLVDIAVFIEQRTDTLRIPWSWSDFTGYIWTNKAFKKRTGVNQQSVNSS